MTFNSALEKVLEKVFGRDIAFNKVYVPIKLGDVPATYVRVGKLYQAVGFKPETSIENCLDGFS